MLFSLPPPLYYPGPPETALTPSPDTVAPLCFFSLPWSPPAVLYTNMYKSKRYFINLHHRNLRDVIHLYLPTFLNHYPSTTTSAAAASFTITGRPRLYVDIIYMYIYSIHNEVRHVITSSHTLPLHWGRLSFSLNSVLLSYSVWI